MIDVPVIIVGGGPVGLTASILLSQHGIRSLLAERHPGTAILPKARGINARTMEMYRQCGVEQEIRDAGLPVERTGLIVWTKSLAGEEIERRVPGRATPQNMAVTPVRNCLCAQDYLEPVLRSFAERQGLGELRFAPRPPCPARVARARRGSHLDDRSLRPTVRAPDGPPRRRLARGGRPDHGSVAPGPCRVHGRGRRRARRPGRHVAGRVRGRRRGRSAGPAGRLRGLAEPRGIG